MYPSVLESLLLSVFKMRLLVNPEVDQPFSRFISAFCFAASKVKLDVFLLIVEVSA